MHPEYRYSAPPRRGCDAFKNKTQPVILRGSNSPQYQVPRVKTLYILDRAMESAITPKHCPEPSSKYPRTVDYGPTP